MLYPRHIKINWMKEDAEDYDQSSLDQLARRLAKKGKTYDELYVWLRKNATDCLGLLYIDNEATLHSEIEFRPTAHVTVAEAMSIFVE